MTTLRKAARWMVGTILFALTLFVTGLLIVPIAVDLGFVKERIVGQVSKQVGGQVETEEIEVSFFPLPHGILRKARFSIPGVIAVNLDSLWVYPSLAPLLSGEVRFSKVRAIAPEVTLTLSEKSDPAADGQDPIPSAGAKEILAAMALVASQAPGLLLEVERGAFHLRTKGEAIVSFWDVGARIASAPDGLDVTLGCSWQRAGRQVVIKEMGLRASTRVREDGASLYLRDLSFQDPQLRVSGELSVDKLAPLVRVRLDSSDVDVASVRRAAMELAGEVPLVNAIFSIVRGGKVVRVIVEAEGKDVEELGRTENIRITGRMVAGRIYIPGPDLEVVDAQGDAVISRGILEGTNLEGRLENGRGRKGTLRVGLEGEAAPLRLDIEVESELSEAYQYMRRIVKDEAFQREMARTSGVRGQGVGRLVLTGTTDSVQVSVDVSTLRLSALYAPIPYAVEIEGGRFSFDGEGIAVQDLRGTVGSSSFATLTARLDLSGAPRLDVASAQAAVELDEIFPWVSSFEAIGPALAGIRSLQGGLSLSAIQFRGPLRELESCEFKILGDVGNVVVDAVLLPEKASLGGAHFEATPEKIHFRDARVGFLDAELTFSGALERKVEGSLKTDVTLEGRAGPGVQQWILEQVKLPFPLKLQPALAVSDGRAAWEGQKAFFSGVFTMSDGIEVSTEVLSEPESLKIKGLTVKDRESDASLSLELSPQTLAFRFKGRLHRSTLDALLADNPFLMGAIEGDVRANVPREQPTATAARGKLRAEDLVLPLALTPPVKVERASLAASEDGILVDSATIRWGDRSVSVDGKVVPSSEGLSLDLTVSAHSIAWEELRDLLGEREETSHLPVRGTLRVKLEEFRYGQFLVSPLRADISLGSDGVDVTVKEATLCGITIPGTLRVTPKELFLAVQPSSIQQSLAEGLNCLGLGEFAATGDFDLRGDLTARGGEMGLLRSLRGTGEFVARQGRIKHYHLLSKVLGFLSVTRVLRGRVPDLGGEGFEYDLARVVVSLREGRAEVKEGLLEGPSLRIAGQGGIDLVTRQVDLQLLLSPLRTADFAVGKIPLVKQFTGGSVVAIPVHIYGDWEDPTVAPLSASALGASLFGIMKRTVQAPLRILDAFNPTDGKPAVEEPAGKGPGDQKNTEKYE
jgi:hypothetical protein